MNAGGLLSESPLAFFVLVFALSIPFWLIGGLTGIELLPGLPVGSLASFSPLVAALILVHQKDGGAGMIELLKRSFDAGRIDTAAWYVPMILLMPALMALSYGLLRLMGTPVPGPQFALLTPLVLFGMFFVAALGEELGWSGYVIDPLQARWNALWAGLLVGVVGAAWHVVLLVQVGRSAEWIAWHFLSLVALRVLMVWLYNNTGHSVFAVTVLHAMYNVSWQLFPVNGSYYDPRITGLIFAGAAVLIVVIWGPQTFTR
jgi:membrane protease YdiL (CAAX protease family)